MSSRVRFDRLTRALGPDEFAAYAEQIRSGRNLGGTLWLGRPAETARGQHREKTCMYSELVHHGMAWLDLARCPKQIAVSCDGCLQYTDYPFYREKAP